jgi:predicted TPR repeat methyltransferase
MSKRKRARDADELVALGHDRTQRGELAEAEALLREAIVVAPGHLVAIAMLGLLLVDRDDPDAAIDLLVPARDAAPGYAPMQLALGTAYAAAGHDELAVAAMQIAIELDSGGTVALERLAMLHIRANRSREAIGLLRRILRRDPAHAHARFLLAGLGGDAAFPSPPPALIADLFNAYASRFDTHLVEKLHYHVPAALAALLAELGVAPDRSRTILDLGCGTGLVGVELREHARALIGSDLSPRMIVRARQRGIYDELHVEDLAATLERARDVDVIVAADVFIYVGALDATIPACARALRAGGLLAFSIERGGDIDFALERSLRYVHGEAYIERLAAAHGLAIERARPTILRAEADRPVQGVLYVARRIG